MTTDKLQFLKETFPTLLLKLNGDEKPLWGKMNAQQMIEHMTDAFRQANEKIKMDIVTPAQHLPAFKAFLMTEKEFRPNTKNPILGEEPQSTVHPTLAGAIAGLQSEINDFTGYFDGQPGKTTTNPVFGILNFDEWVQLLHKHAIHHLKQFGLQ